MARSESFLEERRETLRDMTTPPVNGIDHVEVIEGDPLVLRVQLVHDAPDGGAGGVPSGAAPVAPEHVVISGGDRIRGIGIGDVDATGSVLEIELDRAGDFSTYVLTIDHPGFDRILREIAFGFRAGCRADFDCRAEDDGADEVFSDERIDYLAKDYASFRQTMLDRMVQSKPDLTDREVPDTGITLVELMSYFADRLSHAQDAVATEAYLDTARRRASVRRHARLLGYDMHDGLSARAFVHIRTGADAEIEPAKLKFMTDTGGAEPAAVALDDLDPSALLRRGVRVFEPITPTGNDGTAEKVRLMRGHNALELHDWDDAEAVLPRGATQAWLRLPDDPVDLRPGDFLSLELQRDPDTKALADAQLTHRQIVRLIAPPEPDVDMLASGGQVNLLRVTWHDEDALDLDLPIGTLPASAATDDPGRPQMATAHGNIVLADHGMTVKDAETLPQPDDTEDGEGLAAIKALSELDRPRRYQPVLREKNISVTGALELDPLVASARSLFEAAPRRRSMQVWLSDGSDDDWEPVSSLLFSAPDAKVFVPEIEADGTARLRFGRGEIGGAMPAPGPKLTAHYRVGVGRSGNIGAEAIAHVVLDGVNGPLSARNPLPGFGGQDRETAAQVRVMAPASLTENRRAVTLEDYERLAEEHKDVSRARARMVWHGSWEACYVAIDPVGTTEVTQALLDQVRAHLEPYRLMGQDIEVEPPVFAPLEIELEVCVGTNYKARDVLKAVRQRLSSGRLPDGSTGFFHPDKLSFGVPVYQSRIIAEVRRVEGVVDVRATRFGLWRRASDLFEENRVIEVDPAEIPILMNDRNYPERGVLRVSEWGATA